MWEDFVLLTCHKSNIVSRTNSENKTDGDKNHSGTFKIILLQFSVFTAIKMTLKWSLACDLFRKATIALLRPLHQYILLQWMAVKVSPKRPLRLEPSEVLNCFSASRLWLGWEIVVCLEHGGDLLALMWCWSSWAGRFLRAKRHKSRLFKSQLPQLLF